MRIQEAFFLWLEALGQLYMEGTTVPEVIADTSHRVGSYWRNGERRNGLPLRPGLLSEGLIKQHYQSQ